MSYSRLSASREDISARNKALADAHNAVGIHRRNVEGRLDELRSTDDKDTVVLTTAFASARIHVNAFGEEVVKPKDENVFSVHDTIRHEVAGAVPGNKRLGDLILPCGVCLIVGPGGVGKTPLAHALAAHGEVSHYGTVRIGEPLAGYTSSDRMSALGICNALVHESDVVVDSIKDLLASGSNAMRAGITRQSLVTLSEWSTAACDLGGTMYIPVNPSSVSEEIMDLLGEAARSNATATLIHESGNKWQYYGRTGEGQPRVHATIFLNKDGTVSIEGGTSEVSESRASIALVGALNQYKGAIHRSLVLSEQDDE